MKPMLKSTLLVAATLVAAVGIVFCGALFWIKSNQGLQWVQSRINTAIPGQVTAEKLGLSLVRPGLDLYGVVLHDSRGLSLAGFTHLSVGLDWKSLWKREIRLNRLLLQGPWADLAMDAATGLNLMTALMPVARQKEADAPATDSTGLPFNIVFESVRLTDGRFTFTPSDATMRLEATGLALFAAGNLMARSGNLELAVDSFRFNSAGIRPEPARIVLKAHLDGDKLSVSTLDVTSGHTESRLSGSADSLFTTPLVDAVLSVDSQLAELKSIFNLAGDYAGPVNAKLAIKGTVANPDARLDMTVGKGVIAGQPVDRGDFSIDLKDRQVTIDKAALRLADGSAILNGTVNLRDAFPTGFLAPPADVNAIAYALTLVQDIPNLNRWLKPFIDISGASASRVSLTGNGVIPSGMSARLAIKASGRRLLVPGMDRPVDADVNLSARLNRGTISLSRFNAAADGVELAGEGRFQMDDGALAGKLSLTADNLSRALAVVGLPSVQGACKAALTVGGNLNRPQFSVDLTSKNLKVDTYTLGDLTLKAHLDHDGRLDLTTLSLHNRGTRIQGNGRLRLLPDSGGIDPEFVNALALTLDTLTPAAFMDSPPINGTLDGRLQVGGPLGMLTGGLSLNATALATHDATIGDVDARVRLKAGTVFVDRLQLRNHESAFNAAGSIRVLDPGTLRRVEDPPLDFTIDSKHFDPGDFIGAASGHFSLTGMLGGSLENPAGHISLDGRQANLAGQPVETLSLDVRLADRRLWLDRFLAAVAPGEQVEGGGSVGLDKTIDLHIKSAGISISRIQRLHDFFPGEGMLHLDAAGKGSLENPDIDGHLTISDMIFNEEVIEDVNLDFSLHDMLARITGNLNFDMDATCDLKKGDFDARLIFDRTETHSYFKAAGKPDFHGTLTGRVQAAGNIRDAAHASVNVDLKAFHLLFKDISLIQSGRMVAQLVDQELTIPGFEAAVLSSGSLHLKGDARVGGRLNIELNGRIPLTAAGLFNDELADATGILTLTGKIAGDTDDPQFDARIELENIGMTVPGLVQKVHDLNGRIHLTRDNIRIDTLSGFLDTGSFNLGGTIAHEKFTPTRVNISLEAKSLPLEVPDTLTVLLNGDIKITGDQRNAAARGEIVLLEGLYYKDVKINLLQMTTGRQRAVTPATRPLSIPYFDTVNLDISLNHRQPFLVQNNLAQLEISPDLKIGGRLDYPVISGRAQVKEGTVTFQKKTFDVKKGIIDFINPYKTEAEIDIESETSIRTWTIKLAIKGTPDNLDLKLSSVPTETDSDILSLILFGQTAQELTAGEGAAKRSTGQIMAEMLADTFGADIKKTTGVDILKLETNGSGGGQDAGEVKVTVGKHLSDRMTVKYAVESKDGEFIQRAITEYKLLEHILVSGFQDNQGIYGSELVFRIEFR
ncbi:MAG: translocation/assembly module TamB domain-containing protein [Deltaproteobacteria bacterium]|nr:translocation/assembly module TamB domain-containing protein [Deltaproteobacteria bacterium]